MTNSDGEMFKKLDTKALLDLLSRSRHDSMNFEEHEEKAQIIADAIQNYKMTEDSIARLISDDDVADQEDEELEEEGCVGSVGNPIQGYEPFVAAPDIILPGGQHSSDEGSSGEVMGYAIGKGSIGGLVSRKCYLDTFTCRFRQCQ